eukprot:3670800-Rhodomonas_salina.1
MCNRTATSDVPLGSRGRFSFEPTGRKMSETDGGVLGHASQEVSWKRDKEREKAGRGMVAMCDFFSPSSLVCSPSLCLGGAKEGREASHHHTRRGVTLLLCRAHLAPSPSAPHSSTL